MMNSINRIKNLMKKENDETKEGRDSSWFFTEMNDDGLQYSDNLMIHRFRWLRTTATDGLVFFRALAFVGGLGMMVTSLMFFIFHFAVRKLLLTLFTFFFGFLICVLEAPFFFSSSLTVIQARETILEYSNFLRFLWGRGCFQLFAGLLQLTQVKCHMASGSGAFMCFVGILSILVGRSASRRIKELRNSLNDEKLVKERFQQHDTDGDGFINSSQFSSLLRSFGVALSAKETEIAFHYLDRDDDDLVSEMQVIEWWLGFEVEGLDDAVMNP